PPFHREVPALNKLYDKYKGRVAFYVIYIEETHPIDGWQMPVNVKDHVLLASAKDLEQRDSAAQTCVVKLCISIPALVDDMHDTTEAAYTGWPDRLYVIDRTGRVAYKCGPGPYGFIPDGVRKTLKHLLSPPSRQAN
ncbi:MAG TPA: deiodinase-like protein, partial [Terriglobia bacterium]|nr:deiodinase-like protein [Terriglobia bacterium]